MHGLRVARRLSTALAGVMALQSSLGLLLHSEYRDVAWIDSTWWGNDAVTLFLAVPLLGAALIRSQGDSPRWTLLWSGGLAYGLYNYAYYALGAALNRFFLLYLVCLILAGAAFIMLLSNLNPASFAERMPRGGHRRLIGGYFVFVAAGLSLIWLGMWAAYAFAGRPTPVEPEAFRLVAVLDSALMVPVLAFGGWELWRGRGRGLVVAAFAGVQASLYLMVLSVNSAVAVASGLVEAPGELVIWAPLLIATTIATVALFVSSGRKDPAERQK